MKFAKAYLPLVALVLVLSGGQVRGAVAYSNLPANPPNYNPTMGSNIYGENQDPMMNNTSAGIAMSWVSSQTGTISSLTLGITFVAPANGSVNIFLAENPMNIGPFDVFTSQLLLGQVTTNDQYGTTNSALTTLTNPAPLPVFSGNTYYLVVAPADANSRVVWHANLTGAISSYFFSTDDGVNYTLAGIFDSDALQVDVTAIPEASTWLTGVLVASVLGLVTVRRVRAKARQ